MGMGTHRLGHVATHKFTCSEIGHAAPGVYPDGCMAKRSDRRMHVLIYGVHSRHRASHPRRMPGHRDAGSHIPYIMTIHRGSGRAGAA